MRLAPAALLIAATTGHTAAQITVTDVRRNLVLDAVLFDSGDFETFNDASTDNAIDFNDQFDASLDIGGFTLDVSVAQESSLQGNSLSGSGDFGLGFSIGPSDLGGGYNYANSLRIDFRVDQPTAFDFNASVFDGFISFLTFSGQEDATGNFVLIAELFDSTLTADTSGVLQPGNYFIDAFSEFDDSNFIDDINSPLTRDLMVNEQWNFEFTFVPAPATIVAGPLALLATTRRRRPALEA